MSAVAQHRVALRHAAHFFQKMADVDHGQPAFPQPVDHREEPQRVVFGERARGLIKDDHPGVGDEGSGHLNELLRAHAQIAENRVGTDLAMVQQLKSPRHERAMLSPANQAGANAFLAEHDIGLDAQMRRKGQLLVNHGDAGRSRIARPLGRVRLAPEHHLARIRPDRAAQDLHERALARPILTDQGMHISSVDAQRDAVKSASRPEPLGHPRHFEQHARIVHLSVSPPASPPLRVPEACPPCCSRWDRKSHRPAHDSASPGSAPSAGHCPPSDRHIPIPKEK
jgi:hypothetical protein